VGRISAAITLLPLMGLLMQPTGARALDDVVSLGAFSLDVTGFIEGRAIVSGQTRSWEDGGLGKIRYGGDAAGARRVLARAEGALVVVPKFGFDWSATIVLTANDQQRQAFDLQEAVLHYRPAPSREVGFRARLGAFYPPISLENNGLAWTSPYTITSSAINSWVGEELKTIGGEATIFRRTGDWEIGLTGAVYGYNDPAGTLLAWRGWSFNDRETGFLDRLQLAPLRIFRPPNRLSTHAKTEKPFHEIDGRAGVYAGMDITHADYGKLTALWYDNKADDRVSEKGQFSWRTKFWTLGYQAVLPGDMDLIAQVMKGSTSLITIAPPRGPVEHNGYWSGFALLSKGWDRNRVSVRGEYFSADDRDITAGDDNSERGAALTLAYIYRPASNQRLTLEFLYVTSRRPERAFMGLPARANETQTQASYRFFF